MRSREISLGGAEHESNEKGSVDSNHRCAVNFAHTPYFLSIALL